MVTNKTGGRVFVMIEEESHDAFEGGNQELVFIDRLLLQNGFADVEDMTGVHAVNAVQLHVFRRYFENLLDSLFGRYHFLHQLEKGGIGSGFIHGQEAGWRPTGGPSGGVGG